MGFRIMLGVVLFGAFLTIFGKGTKDYSQHYYAPGDCVTYLSLADGFHYTGTIKWTYTSGYYEISQYSEMFKSFESATQTVHQDEINKQLVCP